MWRPVDVHIELKMKLWWWKQASKQKCLVIDSTQRWRGLAWKQREMMEDLLRLPPVRSRCRELRNHDQKATGSPRLSMVNCFWLACITTCMNSWGLTCQHTVALMMLWLMTGVTDMAAAYKTCRGYPDTCLHIGRSSCGCIAIYWGPSHCLLFW